MAKFAKGNPGGPGRPRGSGHVDICRQWAEVRGWQKLIDTADGKGYKVGLKNGRVVEIGPSQELQLQALKIALEYGYGKPHQAVEVSGDGTSEFAAIPTSTLVEIVAALTGGKA